MLHKRQRMNLPVLAYRGDDWYGLWCRKRRGLRRHLLNLFLLVSLDDELVSFYFPEVGFSMVNGRMCATGFPWDYWAKRHYHKERSMFWQNLFLLVSRGQWAYFVFPSVVLFYDNDFGVRPLKLALTSRCIICWRRGVRVLWVYLNLFLLLGSTDTEFSYVMDDGFPCVGFYDEQLVWQWALVAILDNCKDGRRWLYCNPTMVSNADHHWLEGSVWVRSTVKLHMAVTRGRMSHDGRRRPYEGSTSGSPILRPISDPWKVRQEYDIDGELSLMADGSR